MLRFTQILGVLFAFSFLFSAYTKWIAPGYFEITLLDQSLASNRAFAGVLSRLIIGLELALGFSLLLPFYRKALLAFAFFMLSVFTLHLLYLWGIGLDQNCGCFGELIAMSPLESIFKNLLLLLLAAILYKKSGPQNKAPRVFIFLCLLFMAIPWVYLPLPDYEALSFSQYTHFEKKGRVDLSQGKKWVAVFNLDCLHCQETAQSLAQWEREQEISLPLYVLYFKEGTTTVEAFEIKTQTNYPYSFIDANTFFDLIGESPPRIYHLQDGLVVDYWDDYFIERLEAEGIN